MDKELNIQDKKKKRLFKAFIFSILFLSILTGLLAFSAPLILKKVIENQASKYGFNEFKVEKIKLNTKFLEFQNVQLTQLDKISRIKIIPNYKNKSIKEIIIANANINAYLNDDNIKIIDQIIPFKSDKSEPQKLDLPINTIQILDSNINLFNEFGDFNFNVTALIEKTDNNLYNIKSSIKNDNKNLKTDVKLSGTINQNAEYNLLSNIQSLDVHLLGVKATGVSGQVLISNDIKSSDLKVKNLNIFAIPFSDIDLKYQGDINEQELIASGKSNNSSFNIDVKLGKFEEEKLQLEGNLELSAKDLGNVKQEFVKDLSGNVDLRMNIDGIQGVDDDLSTWEKLSGEIDLKSDNLSIKEYLKKANIISKFKFKSEGNVINLNSNNNVNFSAYIKDNFIKTTINSSKSPINIKLTDKQKIDIVLPNGFKISYNKDNLNYTGKLNLSSDIKFNNVEFETSKGNLSARYDQYKVDSNNFKSKGSLKSLNLINLNASSTNNIINGIGVKAPKFNSDFKLSGNLDNQLKFNGNTNIKNKVNITFNGKHNIKSNKGNANLNIKEFTFNKNIQPHDILPMLKGQIQNAEGNIGYRGNITWNKSNIDGKGDLLLKSFNLDTNDLSLKNINTVAKINDISPITINKQDLSIESFGEEFPFGNVLMNISLKDKDLDVNSASLEIAGGTIKSRPFKMNLDKPNATIILEVDALNLQNIFEIATLKGINATGFVKGTIPLNIRDDLSFSLHDGVLSSPEGGLIEYSVDAMPEFLKNTDNENITYLRTVLESFNYKNLQLKIDDDIIGQKIELKANGYNPDFFDGREVKLNLVLEGSLQNVIKYNLGAYKLPDTINKQIKKYESKK